MLATARDPRRLSVVRSTAFCAAHGVDSEAEYKRRRRDAGELT